MIVNVAVSADGKLSTRERRQVRISGSADFDRVDELKAGSDAIMVGIGTVLADNPSLTIKSDERIAGRRREGKPDHPVRIVIDSMARTPPDAKILHKGPGKRIIAVSGKAPADRIDQLSQYASVIRTGEEQVDLPGLFVILKSRGIHRLMVEGGGTLIAGLFAAGLVDELSMFVGNMIIGGSDAPTLADGTGWFFEEDFPRLSLIGITPLDEGIHIRWNVARTQENN